LYVSKELEKKRVNKEKISNLHAKTIEQLKWRGGWGMVGGGGGWFPLAWQPRNNT
jgi:hypothetical protein